MKPDSGKSIEHFDVSAYLENLHKEMKYDYIDGENKLIGYIGFLKSNGTQLIALDIECEFNRHEYGEKLCLVQIYDGTRTVVIDPFRTPLELTKSILENRSFMKIMYDAPGDRAFLYKNYGIDTLSILDLQQAVALLEYEKRDLASVLKHALGIDGGRSKGKYQQYNWNTRPLDEEAIKYAIEDVAYLIELKSHLLERIVAGGLLEKFLLKNLQVQNKPHIYDTRPGLLRSRRFRNLTKKEQNVFGKLFSVRDIYAQRFNLPPNTVLKNEMLFQLATKRVSIKDVVPGKTIPNEQTKQIIKDMENVLP